MLSEKSVIEKKLTEARRQLVAAIHNGKENVGVNTSFKHQENLHYNEYAQELDTLKINYGVLDDNFNTLQKKYEMAKRLCVLRNDDLGTLRGELDVKKAEIERMTNKYEDAKRICLIRMEKIVVLREQLGIAGTESDKEMN